ncbi:MAG: RdgB/HAM1 family non-canonical purine NTP pyrophosphatase [Gammaproteobacteria bacterium]|nr:RdgB/HAM1 family non-canonical purine NTP pyrophosphatase [Gammaproteobacteria bacterium]
MSERSPRRVVVATGNPGKVKELGAALAGLRFELLTQGELGIEAAPETSCTFLENALGKARHAARESGLPAIADDSGLVVPALGGAPGIHSARYAGTNASDAANNAKLLGELPSTPSPAHFTCCLVYLQSPRDPAPIIATARWHGLIIDSPRGTNGFGYDPHFLVPTLGKTAGQLAVDEKNRLSHRGKACRMLAELMADDCDIPISRP